jgi:hypothetical protein
MLQLQNLHLIRLRLRLLRLEPSRLRLLLEPSRLRLL